MALSQTPTKRVIVVDDNETLLKAWGKILNPEALNLFTTSNPEEALDFLETQGADLLISDVVMPHMDGFELLRKIPGSLSQSLIIILTTAYVCNFHRLKLFLGNHPVHVLLKPYNDIVEIRRFIKRLLQNDSTLFDEGNHQIVEDTSVHLWNF